MKFSPVIFALSVCFFANAIAAQVATPTPSPTPAARVDKSPHKSDFVTVNGVRLHYLDWGGSGEAVVFLHGFPGSAHNFDEMAPKFADKFRVLALTRRGHGQSEKIETGYETDNLVEDLRQFLDAMKIERVNLIGFSAGGDELTRFAGLYPKRVLKLVYLDAAYDRRDITEIDKNDPLFDPKFDQNLTKIDIAMIKSQDTFRPDYSKIKAPTLSYYAIMETHYALNKDTSPEMQKKAQDFVEKVIQPRQFKNIAKLRKQHPKAKIVILRNTEHNFYRDPKLKDQVASEIKEFLLSK
jgi:pimeloyl-ACP methyl ester carboxylesterase